MCTAPAGVFALTEMSSLLMAEPLGTQAEHGKKCKKKDGYHIKNVLSISQRGFCNSIQKQKEIIH